MIHFLHRLKQAFLPVSDDDVSNKKYVDITGALKAPLVHQHETTDIVGLQAALAANVPDLSGAFFLGQMTPFSGNFSGKHPIDSKTGKARTDWALCDGTNGTPNLVGMFIRGGATSGATGGSDTHVHTATSSSSGSMSGSVGSTTLTTSQMPAHNHSGTYTKSQLATGGGSSFYGYYGITLGGGNETPPSIGVSPISSNVVSQGGGSPHTHSLSSTSVTVSTSTTVKSAANLPPYYTLAWIMKIA